MIDQLLRLPPLVLIAVLCLLVIGGLGYIIFLLIQQNRTTDAQMATLRHNDLHELPDIAETLRRIENQNNTATAAILLQLANIRESMAYIRARVERRTDI